MNLLQGTLDLLVLRTLQNGPLHGWAISERIQQISQDVLQEMVTRKAAEVARQRFRSGRAGDRIGLWPKESWQPIK